MMMSPRVSPGSNCSIVCSTGAPAGTMIQTTRGVRSRRQRSARSFAASAPIPTCCLHGLGAPIEHHDLVPTLQQTLHHVAAHATQADHGQLHLQLLSRQYAQARQVLAQLGGVGESDGLHTQAPGGLQVLLPVVDEHRRLRIRLRHRERHFVDPMGRLEGSRPSRS